jgi:ureidoglycolate dehydrogenase (NAD+)/(2R)-3-sulfolactate dehydrogenase (NADP+)
VRATTHTAALGFYTRRAAAAGCLGIAFSGSSPNMAYHGARVPGVATSPLSLAAPGGAEGAPIVLDIASGIVSQGRLVQARKLGLPLPPGLAIDREGNPTTDPAKAHVPLPMAGPKGSGLALMIELLSSVLAGNPLLAESLEGTALGKRHRQNAVCIAIDIGRFIDPAAFAAEAGRLARDIHALPPVDPEQPVLTPGERGDQTMRQRAASGIPLPPPVVADLRALAGRLSLELPAPLVPTA